MPQQHLNLAPLRAKASATVCDWEGREKHATQWVHQMEIHLSSLWQKPSEEVKDRASKGSLRKQCNTGVTESCSAPGSVWQNKWTQPSPQPRFRDQSVTAFFFTFGEFAFILHTNSMFPQTTCPASASSAPALLFLPLSLSHSLSLWMIQ